MTELGYVALFAALALAAGALAGWVSGSALLRESGPVATRQALEEMHRLRLEWDAWRKGAESVLESLDDLEQTIERKRRRVAAAESSKANGPAAGSRQDLLARARALGHPV